MEGVDLKIHPTRSAVAESKRAISTAINVKPFCDSKAAKLVVRAAINNNPEIFLSRESRCACAAVRNNKVKMIALGQSNPPRGRFCQMAKMPNKTAKKGMLQAAIALRFCGTIGFENCVTAADFGLAKLFRSFACLTGALSFA